MSRRITSQEINDAAQYDPLKASLMVMANANQDYAENLDAGARREPTVHKAGWRIALPTKSGYVCLWSCWLENRFFLTYPLGRKISDEKIMETLGVEIAQPVANSRFGLRKWAYFYGPKLPEDQGRVWVSHTNDESESQSFKVVTTDGQLDYIHHGFSRSFNISTYPSSFFNSNEPEGPNSQSEVIQSYKDKFLELLCVVSEVLGWSLFINIDYGLLLTPGALETEGYENITSLSSELVRAQKRTEYGLETLMLQKGNSMVPWITVRNVPVPILGKKSKFVLDELLTF